MSAVETITTTEGGRDFIRDIVAADLAAGRVGEVVTRFPPEPNGYLHIGHAKSICLNFGVAQEFGGRCHLRFDDTNPTREEQEYIDAIERDVRWLGFDWGPHLHYASDYFEQLYTWAEHLIEHGHAYVDDQLPDEMRAARGTLTEPGRDSPYRNRTPAENLDLFRRMRAGEFPNGACVLRAKIDMASGNMNLRDPVLYRILHAEHPRTGGRWCIYPTYDYAHGQSDAIEGITHSICTLEFEDHRPLYDWLIEHLPVPSRPRQYEFARLSLGYTGMSKRFLKRLVVDIGEALLDQVLGPAVELLEMVGRMVEVRPPVEAEPAHVALDRVDIFLLLLGRVGIVEAQVAAAAEFLGDAEIKAERLGVADMQIAVGLRREAGHDFAHPPGGEVGRDDVANEIAPAFGCRHRLDRAHALPPPETVRLMWRSSDPAPTPTRNRPRRMFVSDATERYRLTNWSLRFRAVS